MVAFTVFTLVSIVMVWFTIVRGMDPLTTVFTTFVSIGQLLSYLMVALRNPGVANIEEPSITNAVGPVWYTSIKYISGIAVFVISTKERIRFIVVIARYVFSSWTIIVYGQVNALVREI